METTTSTKERSSTEGEAADGRMKQEQAMVEVVNKQMNVMVAIDDSEESFHALKWALDHLFFFLPSSSSSTGVAAPEAEPTPNQEQGKVILLHVQEAFLQYYFSRWSSCLCNIFNVGVCKESPRTEIRSTTGPSIELMQGEVQAEAMILNGEPKEMICQATEQIQPSLLVIGSRGLGKIKRAFLGSVSEYCAHHAKCPILIVKPPK